jgi:hypothetical protein
MASDRKLNPSLEEDGLEVIDMVGSNGAAGPTPRGNNCNNSVTQQSGDEDDSSSSAVDNIEPPTVTSSSNMNCTPTSGVYTYSDRELDDSPRYDDCADDDDEEDDDEEEEEDAATTEPPTAPSNRDDDDDKSIASSSSSSVEVLFVKPARESLPLVLTKQEERPAGANQEEEILDGNNENEGEGVGDNTNKGEGVDPIPRRVEKDESKNGSLGNVDATLGENIGVAGMAFASANQGSTVDAVGSTSGPPFCITEIVDSPYKENANAEVGEESFDDLKQLMEPVKGRDGTLRMNPEMQKLFGENFDKVVYDIRQAIKASKECYDPAWMDGRLAEDQQVRWVPSRQLVACLCEDRLASASQTTLNRICRDLDTTKAVRDALAALNVQEDFPNLAACNKTILYNEDANVRACCLCEIFVARALSFLIIMRRTETVASSIVSKIRSCLTIMNKHCGISRDKVLKLQKDWERKRQKAARKLLQQERRHSSSKETASSKSPGIESRSSSHSINNAPGPVTEISVARAAEEGSESSVVTTELATSDSTRAGNRNINPNTTRIGVQNAEDRRRSLIMLYNIVQEQHNRLGQTIDLLQDSIREHRVLERIEAREEIRAELLKEMKEQAKNKSKERQSSSSKGSSSKKRSAKRPRHSV